jgi:hypothetical protein
LDLIRGAGHGEHTTFSLLATVSVGGLRADGHVAGVEQIRQLNAFADDDNDDSRLTLFLLSLGTLFGVITASATALGLTSVSAAKRALERLQVPPAQEIPCDAFAASGPSQWGSLRRVNLRSADGRQIIIGRGVQITPESDQIFGIDIAGYLLANCAGTVGD